MEIREKSKEKVYSSLVDVDSLIQPFLNYLCNEVIEKPNSIKNFKKVFYEFVKNYDDQNRGYFVRGEGIKNLISISNVEIDVNDIDIIISDNLFSEIEEMITEDLGYQVESKNNLIEEVRNELSKKVNL